MLYQFLRPITRIALNVYFKRITINGLENIPKDGPLILSCNHPTAFIEPCLLACFLPRTLHFLVRGDLFNRPILKILLLGTNQIPIYRLRDGFSNLRSNEQYLNMSRDILVDGKVILIFSEASAEEVRHVRKIQKGLARIVYDTLKFDKSLPLKVIPIGINYLSPNDFRSHVTINIGQPIIPVLPEAELIPNAVTSLTLDIEQKMEPLLLARPPEKEVLDGLVFLHDWNAKVRSRLFKVENDFDYFSEQRLMSEKLAEGKVSEEVILKVEQIMEKIHSRGLRLIDFKLLGSTLFTWLILLILLIPVGIGVLLNGIPPLVGKILKDKYVKKPEFLGAVQIGATIGVYLVIFILIFILMLFLFGWWALLLFVIPFYGYFMMPLWDLLSGELQSISIRRKLGRENINEITMDSKRIVNQLLKK